MVRNTGVLPVCLRRFGHVKAGLAEQVSEIVVGLVVGVVAAAVSEEIADIAEILAERPATWATYGRATPPNGCPPSGSKSNSAQLRILPGLLRRRVDGPFELQRARRIVSARSIGARVLPIDAAARSNILTECHRKSRRPQ